MNHAIKMTALAVFAASFAVPALANKSNELDLYVDSETQSLFSQPGPGRVKLGTFQPVDAKAQAKAKDAGIATSKGGLEIKSADGNYSAKLGARVHFDANYVIDEDDLTAAQQDRNSTLDFRRARLSLSGKVYNWEYLFENDFAGQDTTNRAGFRDVWLGTHVKGNRIRIGQAKPFRGMEELTSSNSLTFMERPFATANGIYQRQRTLGLFVNNYLDDSRVGYGLSVYNNKAGFEQTSGGAVQPQGQALGYNGRVFVLPIKSAESDLHVAFSASQDGAGDASDNAAPPEVTGIALQPRTTRNGQLRPTVVGATQGFDKQTTYAGELAYRVGRFTAQGEYALANFTDSVVAGQADEDVETGYIQLSYFLTDHAKRYSTTRGAFDGPSVKSGSGAIELKARYDFIKNTDRDNREASGYAVGVNYYVSPNVRFMVEYHDGEASGASGTPNDAKFQVVTARAQLNF